jgi:co-chaperonin GroES (HSP10)
MQPIGKYIVVKTIEEDIKTESGLYLSGDDANQLRYKKGIVVKPGTDVTVINELDTIYYDKGHGFTMIINDAQYTIIQERDVVVVL